MTFLSFNPPVNRGTSGPTPSPRWTVEKGRRAGRDGPAGVRRAEEKGRSQRAAQAPDKGGCRRTAAAGHPGDLRDRPIASRIWAGDQVVPLPEHASRPFSG